MFARKEVELRTLALDATGRVGRLSTTRVLIPGALLLVALAGWWWSVRSAAGTGGSGMAAMAAMDGMSLGAFVVAWVAMMAAMMLPAVLPVVKLYGLAVARGRAAPTGFFVLGYLAVWTVMAAPAYVGWRALEAPLAEAQPWVARVAGVTFLVAALWQLTPLKVSCLRHCRSPLGFFLRYGGRIRRRQGAVRLGAAHGAVCVGCCWPLFAVLVVLGTMNLVWMALLTAVIVLEKNAPRGEAIAAATGAVLAVLGAALLIDTSTLSNIT